jgi:hypothetical protein
MIVRAGACSYRLPARPNSPIPVNRQGARDTPTPATIGRSPLRLIHIGRLILLRQSSRLPGATPWQPSPGLSLQSDRPT